GGRKPVHPADLALIEGVKVEILRHALAPGGDVPEQPEQRLLGGDEVAEHLPGVPGAALGVDGYRPVVRFKRAEERGSSSALLTQTLGKRCDAVGHRLALGTDDVATMAASGRSRHRIV